MSTRRLPSWDNNRETSRIGRSYPFHNSLRPMEGVQLSPIELETKRERKRLLSVDEKLRSLRHIFFSSSSSSSFHSIQLNPGWYKVSKFQWINKLRSLVLVENYGEFGQGSPRRRDGLGIAREVFARRRGFAAPTTRLGQGCRETKSSVFCSSSVSSVFPSTLSPLETTLEGIEIEGRR